MNIKLNSEDELNNFLKESKRVDKEGAWESDGCFYGSYVYLHNGKHYAIGVEGYNDGPVYYIKHYGHDRVKGYYLAREVEKVTRTVVVEEWKEVNTES